MSGKVKEIRRILASEKKNVIFDYDAMGNRIAKHIYNNQTAMLERSTYYILDAQGNQLSMYDHKVTDNAVVYYLSDRNIYGSSRLGSLRDTVNMFIPTNLPSYGVVGNRNYELSNHLGNVLAVVNDIVYPISDDSTTILSYEVGLSMVSDYSPFGVQLDGRTIQNEMYSPVSNDTSSQTTPIIAEIYKNEFDSPPATTNPYTGATTTLDGNLSNPVWTSSTGDFTNYNSTGAGSGKSIAIQNASPDTSYVTLSLDVDSGYLFDITSYSFAHRSSSTGYDSYKLVVNGIEIGTGSIYVASSGSTLQSTGVVNVSNVVSGVTGTVNVVLKLYGGLHGSTGTFRMDDFILNGYTQEENTGNGSGNGYVVMGGYRYGFQGQEMDDEISGSGNSIDFGARMYNPRIGRWFSLDPFAAEYPSFSDYSAMANNPILNIDKDGEKIYIYYTTKDENGKTINKAYEYGSGLKLPKDKFVRKTVRTLNRLEKRGKDPYGIIDKFANDEDNHVAINENEDWNGPAFIIETGEVVFEDNVSKEDFIIPPDQVSWNPRAGLISPDGEEKTNPQSILLHEIGHKYFNMFIRGTDDDKTGKPDDWLIENVEPADDKNWKRTNHREGYYLKTIGGTSSRFGITYGRWGKEDKVWNLKKGDAIEEGESSSSTGESGGTSNEAPSTRHW
nr:RHS repeat-associated core domain-containing protein [uncultured Brumimicrobium sp.]